MHGNNPHSGLPGTTPTIGQQVPEGVDPGEISDDEWESLRTFASRVAQETDSYLPQGYFVNTEFRTAHGSLTLGITVGCPSGSAVQCDIQPVPNDGAEMTDEEKEAENESRVDEISQQLAASAAAQSMMIAEQHGNPDQPAS